VAERLMAAVLKTVVTLRVTVGSNPTPSVFESNSGLQSPEKREISDKNARICLPFVAQNSKNGAAYSTAWLMPGPKLPASMHDTERQQMGHIEFRRREKPR
jgi:hypothetical protein